MLCVVIRGPTADDVRQQMESTLYYADIFEFRLDGFDASCINTLKELRDEAQRPVLFTLRTRLQGGLSDLNAEDWCKAVLHFLRLHPDFIDLEHPVPKNLIEQVRLEYPKTKIVLSYHDFVGIAKDLDYLFESMKKTIAHFYKIAVSVSSSLETIEFLWWMKDHNTQNNLIAIPMGSHGQFGRVLGLVLGSPWAYASVCDEENGLLPAHILAERYGCRLLNRSTKICGLIGDPVSQSPSDLSHNAFFSQANLNTVYVKMRVSAKELPKFLDYAKQISFLGLSVTMPLKEAVLPLLDQVDAIAAEIGSVNTIKFEKGRLLGYNTDVLGALQALKQKTSLEGKRVVLMGAGGSAKAIVYGLVKNGAIVTIVNRHRERADALANLFGGQVVDFTDFPKEYDVLINCTPKDLPLPIDKILPKIIVFDLVINPKETLLIRESQKKGCTFVYGVDMFVHQAREQFKIWFS